MKMSSRRSSLEGSPVAQHRPQDVDPFAGERNHRLGVFLAFGPLAIVESPGPVAISALYDRLGPGLVATVLSVLASDVR